MNLHQVEFEETGRFSSIFLDYIHNNKSLQPFYNQPPEIRSFEKIINQRNFDESKRIALVNTLEKQYDGIEISQEVSDNILRTSIGVIGLLK